MSGFPISGSQQNRFPNQGPKTNTQGQNFINPGFSNSGGFNAAPNSSASFPPRPNVEIDLYGGLKTQSFNTAFQSGSSSKSTTQPQGFQSQIGASSSQKPTQPSQGGFQSSFSQGQSQFPLQKGGFGSSSTQSSFQGFKPAHSPSGSISTGFPQSTAPSQAFSKGNFSSNPVSGSSFQPQGTFSSSQSLTSQKSAFPSPQGQGFGPQKGSISSNPGSQSSQTFSSGFQASVPQSKASFAPPQAGFPQNKGPFTQSQTGFGGKPPTSFQGFNKGPINIPSASMSSGGITPAFSSSGFGGFPVQQPQSMFPPKSDVGVYSETLTEEESNAFKSDKFMLGKIPLNPPTKELCQ